LHGIGCITAVYERAIQMLHQFTGALMLNGINQPRAVWGTFRKPSMAANGGKQSIVITKRVVVNIAGSTWLSKQPFR
jgi:hypothetical protein